MQDPLGFEGARVVVTGCASGMGMATAEILGALGAEVIGLDVKEIPLDLAQQLTVDLRDPGSIDAAVATIDGGIDSKNCFMMKTPAASTSSGMNSAG